VFLPAVAGTIYTYELSGTICSCACTNGKAFVQVARWDRGLSRPVTCGGGAPSHVSRRRAAALTSAAASEFFRRRRRGAAFRLT
jgi:hypothetical protein